MRRAFRCQRCLSLVRYTSRWQPWSETRQVPLQAAVRLFDAVAPTGDGEHDARRPVIDEWLRVTGWFQKQAHDSRRQDAAYGPTDFVERFEQFERILVGLVRPFFKTIDELDRILEETNS